MDASNVFQYILTNAFDSDLSEYVIVLLSTIIAHLRVDHTKLVYKAYSPLNVLIKSGHYTSLDVVKAELNEVLLNYSKEPKVIWFNTWFSSIASVISDIKKTMPSVKVVATNKSKDCTYANIADEFYTEPFGCNKSDYLAFALDFCKQHNVSAAWPKSYSMTLQENVEKFNSNGIGIISEQLHPMQVCRSKDDTYRFLTEHGYDRQKIPEYYIADNVTNFRDYYNRLIRSGDMCFKFDADEGASSFRIIRRDKPSFNSLKEKVEDTISYADAIEILSDNGRQEKFKPLMVMPLLDGPEISVDCYNSPNIGFIAIPRYKISGRIKKIELNQEIIDDARRVGDILGIKSAYNVQYRWSEDNKPVLLEVNTRISGGIQMSSLAGISIPNQLVADSFGIPIVKGELRNCTVTQYEKAILI